jgi:hypothetical protein
MTKEYGTPGPRPIHPEIARSRSLRHVGVLANALFPRLLPLADDQGRGSGDAAELAAVSGILLIPGVTLEAALAAVSELRVEGVVALYEVDGEAFWQLTGWWQWQGPAMRRAYPSRYPPPPGWADAVYGSGDEGAPKTWREALGLPPGQRGPRPPRGDPPDPAREPLPRSAETTEGDASQPAGDPPAGQFPRIAEEVPQKSETVRTSPAEPSPAGPARAEPSPDGLESPHVRTREASTDGASPHEPATTGDALSFREHILAGLEPIGDVLTRVTNGHASQADHRRLGGAIAVEPDDPRKARSR